jgi:putative Mg2+ transporter-C (MgtC) family protein
MFYTEMLLRIALAVLVGFVIGLNRWIHHKSAGGRTHALVALGGALAVVLIDGQSNGEPQATSRVLQGLITGIGFLGAGVILRAQHAYRVHGLTTAASLWTCALLGAAFGAGQFELGLVAAAAALLVLMLGGKIEMAVGRSFNKTKTTPADAKPPANAGDQDHKSES